MAIEHPDFTFDNLEKFVVPPAEISQFLAIILEGYLNFFLSLGNDPKALYQKNPNTIWNKTVSLANTNRYRNVSMSIYLVKIFCDMFMNSERFKESMLRLNGGDLVTYKIRPSILPAKWIAELEEENRLVDEVKMITQFLRKRKKEFCEASISNPSNSLLHNYLLTARTLDCTLLSPEKKIILLSQVFADLSSSNADVCQKLILLNILCSMNVFIQDLSWSSKEDLINPSSEKYP